MNFYVGQQDDMKNVKMQKLGIPNGFQEKA